MHTEVIDPNAYSEIVIMMRKNIIPATVIIMLGVSVLGAFAADPPGELPLVSEAYPGLASGTLTYARLSDLPAGMILRAHDLTIKDTEVADQIAQAPAEMQPQLKKNAFFLLENRATRQLLLAKAKAETPEQQSTAAADEETLIQTYLKGLVTNAEVSDAEVTKFYEENKEACGGATLDQVKDQLRQMVLQQKQQAVIDEHVRTLGQRMTIEVSASWTKEQSVLAKDNPVEKARNSGTPSLVDLGSTGCIPCDMLAPILDTLKGKYSGKLNVLFVHVGQEQVLAARYGVRTIPTQIFYDENGKEVFRHVGFWAQAEIEKQLADMGVTP